MIGQALRHLQDVLNQKADAVQREFNGVGDELRALGRKIVEAQGMVPEPLIAEQAALREKQQVLAEAVNQWRDRAQAALRQQGGEALQAYLSELLATGDETVCPAAERVRYLLSAPEEELNRLAEQRAQARPTTPVGRLVERAHTERDLRGEDPAPRQTAAFEFANRAGMAQNDQALAELEAAVEDNDSLANEVVTLTLIQMYRFRARHLSDLDAAHDAVERLTHIKHPAVVPVLIEVLATPRTGFVQGDVGMIEANNSRSRSVALKCLAQWRTAEAQAAVRARQNDPDPHIAQEAQQVMESFPGEWT